MNPELLVPGRPATARFEFGIADDGLQLGEREKTSYS